MQLFSFVFILYLGFKFLLAQTINVPTKLDAASEKIESRLETKLHPHSAFMTGFVRPHISRAWRKEIEEDDEESETEN